MEIMAIGGMFATGMPIPTAQGEMPGMFGATLQSALESVSMQTGLPKKGLKEDFGAICQALADLISANLLQNVEPITMQDVQQWVQGAIENGSIPMEALMDFGIQDLENLQEIVEQIQQTIVQEDQPAGKPEFDIILKVLTQIQEHAVQKQELSSKLQQDAPVKIAGEMRVISTEKQSEVPQILGKEAEPEKGEIGTKDNLYPVGADTKIEHDVDLVFEQVQTDNVETKLVSSVLERIETALSAGNNKLFIRLKPDVLGGIAMKLTMSEEGLIARIVTTNQQTQNILNTQVSDLENVLRDRGIKVASMEISYNAMNEDTRKQDGNQHFEQSKQQRRFEISSIDYEDTENLMEIYNMMMAPSGEEETTIYRA